ncbi:MAG: DVUA0089 family protein [Gammaproteobacteria bacterium]|nr:DVUA0089 family protein [Gammaproteobacteria bacterium]
MIAFNDDIETDAFDPGSAHDYDNFIGEIELQPGNYLIAVSQYPNEPLNMECLDPLMRPDEQYGGERCISESAAFLETDYTSDDPSLEDSYRLYSSLPSTDTTPPAKPEFCPGCRCCWSDGHLRPTREHGRRGAVVLRRPIRL